MKAHVQVQLTQTVIGLAFIANSFVPERLSGIDSTVMGFSALSNIIEVARRWSMLQPSRHEQAVKAGPKSRKGAGL